MRAVTSTRCHRTRNPIGCMFPFGRMRTPESSRGPTNLRISKAATEKNNHKKHRKRQLSFQQARIQLPKLDTAQSSEQIKSVLKNFLCRWRLLSYRRIFTQVENKHSITVQKIELFNNLL